MTLFAAGVVLVLASFLAPAWPLLSVGEVRFEPTGFPWAVYGLGYVTMSASLWWSAPSYRAS